MAGKVFNSGDLVLVKTTGEPYWPAVVKPCIVEEGDENYEFNGEYRRAPNWYWVLFFEDSDVPETGLWTKLSKMKKFDYKMAPALAKNGDLSKAHASANKWVETYRQDLVDEYNNATDKDVAAVTANGDVPPEVPNGDAGNTGDTVRRTSRRVKKSVISPDAEEQAPSKSVAAKRPSTTAAAKRKRGRVNAPAQKRPRRVKLATGEQEGDMELTIGELRKALWAERTKSADLAATVDAVRKAVRRR